MGAISFTEKQAVYRRSTIGMTRRLADENAWNEEVLSRRSGCIAGQVLVRWPWSDDVIESTESPGVTGAFRWRIEEGPWRNESSASQLILNVASALLSLDSAHADKLAGVAISTNVHPATRYAPDEFAGTLRMRAVPNHPDYVIYPYGMSYPKSAERCRIMGERCGVRVEAEVVSDESDLSEAFWKFIKEQFGGIQGQTDKWRGANQWTGPVNAIGDWIGISMKTTEPERVSLYIRAAESKASVWRTERMKKYSQLIRENLADQRLGNNLVSEASKGRSITVDLLWMRDDIDVWPHAAQWILDQCQRLREIANELPMVKH